MANNNLAQSFKVQSPHLYQPIKFLLNASYAGKAGDVASLGTDGYATDTLTAVILGIQDSGINAVADGVVADAATAVDAVYSANFVTDPDVVFKGQITTFAATDPYTTRSAGAAYDVAGNAGVQYINAAASTTNQIKIMGLSTEDDTGLESAVGAYAKVLACFVPASHFRGTIA